MSRKKEKPFDAGKAFEEFGAAFSTNVREGQDGRKVALGKLLKSPFQMLICAMNVWDLAAYLSLIVGIIDAKIIERLAGLKGKLQLTELEAHLLGGGRLLGVRKDAIRTEEFINWLIGEEAGALKLLDLEDQPLNPKLIYLRIAILLWKASEEPGMRIWMYSCSSPDGRYKSKKSKKQQVEPKYQDGDEEPQDLVDGLSSGGARGDDRSEDEA